MASTDHHAGFPVSYGDGLAAILAEKKTRESIWEAIKAGRTYAVTGDRIRCDFQINGVCMGGSLFASRRQIQAHVETEAPLDKIVLYKNGRAVRIINGEFFRQVNQTGCYKIRIAGEEAFWLHRRGRNMMKAESTISPPFRKEGEKGKLHGAVIRREINQPCIPAPPAL